ncbi:MAG: hypothetical protein Q8O56_10605 [Solirubrobacteraceae bacterium]|nr:hypothetical protein [Solirubrobacteraceae bacterium]
MPPVVATCAPCSRRSGRRLVALALAATAVAGAALAGPSAGAAHGAAGPSALATGTSDASAAADRSRSHWRLAGRRLTVVLPRALVAGAGNRVVTATAECGESTVTPQRFDEVHPWATLTRGRGRVAASTRTVRILLTRDVAARTNLCTLSVAATQRHGSFATRAAMTVRRGPARGCRPGPRERVVHQSATIRVTTARATTSAGTTIDGYRTCLLPRGNLQRIDRAGDIGGAGGSATTATRFTSSGRWLTWVSTTTPHSELGGMQRSAVRRIDLRGGRPHALDQAPGAISALATGATGVTAWVRQSGGAAAVQARAPGAATSTLLDGTAAILCVRAPCEVANALTDLAVRGRTVSWRNAGVARSATLP